LVRRLKFSLLVLLGTFLLVTQMVGDRIAVDSVLSWVSFGIYAAIGGLIIFRHDGHLTGWLLTLVGLVITAADGLAYVPGISETMILWVDSWIWTAVFALFALLTLTFPSGRLPDGPSTWARLGRISALTVPVLVGAAAFTETLGGPEAESETVNPIGFLPAWLNVPILLTVVLILLGGALSLVAKRRRAVGAERAQITWVVFGLVLLVTAVLFTFAYIALSIAIGAGDPGDSAWIVVFITMVTFPLWFGIAVLRYRLFEIDRIISRTVAYTLVVALLAATFAATVTVLASLFPAGSDVGVAASTLVVAALFNPLRRRIQTVVDRRFNRSYYDAMRVGAEFAEVVRDEVDLDRIISGWLNVVSGTLQPALVSVWIRDEPQGSMGTRHSSSG
jgi:hypothetical protein